LSERSSARPSGGAEQSSARQYSVKWEGVYLYLRRRNNLGSRFFVGVGVLVLVCILCAVYSGITGNASPVTRIAGAITIPVEKFFSGVSGFVGKGFAYFSEFDDLKAENDSLKKQLREMEQTVRDAQLAIDENNRLRTQLGQPKRSRELTTITSEVIDRNPGDWATTLTLDKGTSHGVAEGNLVITEDGMVGYVISAESNYCKMVTVVDIEMQCGALITRTRESAIAEGNYDLMSENLLRLSYLKEGTDVVVGDTVETSGTGGVFPKGIMIGTVEVVKPEENGISYYAEIKPFVNVDTINSVSIVTAFTDSSDTGNATGDGNASGDVTSGGSRSIDNSDDPDNSSDEGENGNTGDGDGGDNSDVGDDDGGDGYDGGDGGDGYGDGGDGYSDGGDGGDGYSDGGDDDNGDSYD